MIHYLQTTGGVGNTGPSQPVLPLLDPQTLLVDPRTMGSLQRARLYSYQGISEGTHVSVKTYLKRGGVAANQTVEASLQGLHGRTAGANTQSLAELLLGFFAHYAELPLDQALSVATASHVPRPGRWTFERFCILDPLAPDEDLGRHLTPDTMSRLRREFDGERDRLRSGRQGKGHCLVALRVQRSSSV